MLLQYWLDSKGCPMALQEHVSYPRRKIHVFDDLEAIPCLLSINLVVTMIIRNKQTGQYIYESKLIDGKVSVLWTNDKRNACHFSSNLPDKWKGLKLSKRL